MWWWWNGDSGGGGAMAVAMRCGGGPLHLNPPRSKFQRDLMILMKTCPSVLPLNNPLFLRPSNRFYFFYLLFVEYWILNDVSPFQKSKDIIFQETLREIYFKRSRSREFLEMDLLNGILKDKSWLSTLQDVNINF